MSRDDAFLLDMLAGARRVLKYAGPLTHDMFNESDLHQDAIIRRLEIIGEASRQVSDEFRQEHPEIPWPAMVGMRHRLAHDYRRIDLDVIWETIQQKIPELIDQLERIMPDEKS